jgi:hypothetical protein
VAGDDVCGVLDDHVRRFFRGRTIDAMTWTAGPILELNPHFRVLRVAPQRPDDLWTYVSVGGWAGTAELGRGLEFVISTHGETPRAVELLAMTAHYHRGDVLGLGDTLPVGEPWLPGSTCDHLLVSLPYPYGQDLQTCHVGDRHVDFLWLLPITAAERAFKAANGLEALESRFDQAALRYWEPERASVI